jgi:glycosyltransferase involved in cell wall biosynthesis
VKFLIVGDGIMKTKWIQLVNKLKISDKFIFTGRVPYEAVPLYINTSDICVTPKKPIKSGYSPLKLYEYMACCKPVVATRTNGFEIIEEYNAGILINPKNSKEFADAIKTLLHNNNLRIKYGRNGREYVIKNHSWESVVKKVAALCESTVNPYK